MQTETGTMVVATPETTVFDLVRFPAASGSWSTVATVAAKLAEKLEPVALASGAARVSRSDVQRLGWLLDLLAQHHLADALATTLEGRRLVATPLSPARDAVGSRLDARWRVVVNDEFEPDL